MNERKGSRKQRILAWAAAMGLGKKEATPNDQASEAIASLDGLEVSDSSFDEWAAACARRTVGQTGDVAVYQRLKKKETIDVI
nr:hypothetical protein [uncultured Roseateles sp.]